MRPSRLASNSRRRVATTAKSGPRRGRQRSPRAGARTRTGDPFITNEVLYQLSYAGARPVTRAGVSVTDLRRLESRQPRRRRRDSDHRRDLVRARGRGRSGRGAGAGRRPVRPDADLRRARPRRAGARRRAGRPRLRQGRRVRASTCRTCPSTRSPSTARRPRAACHHGQSALHGGRAREPARGLLGRGSCSPFPRCSTPRARRPTGQASRRSFVLGEAEGATPFARRCSATGRRARRRDRPGTDVVALPYSSGTTGPAQGRDADPPQPGREHLPDAGRARRSSREDTLIGVLPFFHIYGHDGDHEPGPARRGRRS